MAKLFSSEIALFLLLSFIKFGISQMITTNPGGPNIMNPPAMTYHNGSLLNGKISINLIWYGKFEPNQKAIVTDFVSSINKPSKRITTQPDVVSWWNLIEKFYYKSPLLKAAKKSFDISLSLGTQISDENYSLGKKLMQAQIEQLAAKGPQNYAVNVVLTAADVVVEGFCSICGRHGFGSGYGSGSKNVGKPSKSRYAYIWVGNSEKQCPGQCAWPFYQPMFGPKTETLVPPNKDKGMDGMVITLSTQLAGTVTNPFRDGFFQGPKEAPLEAATACQGEFARGAYPGFAGDLLVEGGTGASYNAQGVNGRKFMLPDIYDPKDSYCATLV